MCNQPNNTVVNLSLYFLSTCEGAVLPHLGKEIKDKAQIFCPRCDCKYENRNTTIIKVNYFFTLFNFPIF